jgi:hypothetical protein
MFHCLAILGGLAEPLTTILSADTLQVKSFRVICPTLQYSTVSGGQFSSNIKNQIDVIICFPVKLNIKVTHF